MRERGGFLRRRVSSVGGGDRAMTHTPSRTRSTSFCSTLLLSDRPAKRTFWLEIVHSFRRRRFFFLARSRLLLGGKSAAKRRASFERKDRVFLSWYCSSSILGLGNKPESGKKRFSDEIFYDGFRHRLRRRRVLSKGRSISISQ